MNDYNTLLTTHTNTILANKQLVDDIISDTKGMNIPFVHIKQRIWHLANSINTIPICPVCNTKPLKWDKQNNKYSKTCGRSCATKQMANDPEVRKKIELTNLHKYGEKAPALNNEIREKAIQTKIDRYGSSGGQQLADKISASVQSRYGVDNISQLSTVSDKKRLAWKLKDADVIKQISADRSHTCIEKYGESNPMKVPEFHSKAINTNIERYGFPSALSCDDIRHQIISTNIERYGVPHVSQQHISSQSLELLNNKDWLMTQHHAYNRTLSEIANMLDVDLTTVSKYFDNLNITKLRFPVSVGERQIGQFLTDCDVEFISNDKSIISPYELDIYIPSHKIAIEYCGLYWHSDAHERITPSYHANKLKLCKQQGIRLLTIFEDEWEQNQEIVKRKLQSILNKNKQQSVYARNCIVIKIDKHTKQQFLNANHIQGDGPGSITYGLLHKDQLVAVMTFIKQIDYYVLNRYATSTHVPGGFSKLLKFFKQNNDWSSIISFADLRWSEGNMYLKNGFTLDKIIPPDYYWIVNNQRQHKFNWRHSGKLKHLPNYDPSLSETINMHTHGFYKIYNCGLQRWKLSNT